MVDGLNSDVVADNAALRPNEKIQMLSLSLSLSRSLFGKRQLSSSSALLLLLGATLFALEGPVGQGRLSLASPSSQRALEMLTGSRSSEPLSDPECVRRLSVCF